MSDIEEKFGVIFRKKDYAGFFQRLVISMVDLIVIVMVISAALVVSEYLINDYDTFYYFKMILRAFLLILGPFELFFDLIWLTQEATKQTLRDKYVGTYVVKRNATPIGKGRLQIVTLGFMGWSMMYREVKEGLIKEERTKL